MKRRPPSWDDDSACGEMAIEDMSRINAQTRDRSQNIPDFHGISNKGDLMTFLPTSKTGVRRPDNFVKSFSIRSNGWMRPLGIPIVNLSMDCLENVQERIEYINTQLLDEYNRRHDAQLIATMPGNGFQQRPSHPRGDRWHPQVPASGEPLGIRRACADCEKVGIVSLLRRHQQEWV
jgi:hypothetical protein